jgi:hypothetical protein
MEGGRAGSKRKRGRPKADPPSFRQHQLSNGGQPRNQVDIFQAILERMDDDLRRELLTLVDQKKSSLTVVQYVARFPREQQREAFDHLNRLGARGAKRYVECLRRRPSVAEMAMRIRRWARREFPHLSDHELALALAKASIDAKRSEDQGVTMTP